MRVRAERVDSAWVLHLEGRLAVEEDTRQLHELVRSMTHFCPCNVVLDLGNVGQLDCSGIGQLVQLNNQVCGSGGAFALLNVERRQKRLLQLLGLLAVLRVCDRRQEAITGCRSAAALACGLPSERLEASTGAARPAIDGVCAQAV
jgi:anti-anti-sigma factor